MKTITLLALLLRSFGFDLHAQTPSAADLLKFHFPPTNAVPAIPVASPPDYPTNHIPIIQFKEVPITTGIENLARQAGLNFFLQPGLYTDTGDRPVPEPIVTLEWKGMTCRDALDRLCQEYDLKVVDDPCTGVAHITRLTAPKYFIDCQVLGLTTNAPGPNPPEAIPVIAFSDVPLDTALMNLIKQSGRSIELASNLMEHVSQSIDAKGVVTFNLKLVNQGYEGDVWFRPMPEVSIRWENVAPELAVLALCEAYDLEFITDPATGNLQITPRKFKHRHHV
jgi:hypothetical protein